MASPLVTVVIPCYNGAQFVAEAIESGLTQTYSDVEVVVVDDGSTDDSLRVIRSFGPRIRWESMPNGGACRARNRGAAIARGQFLQFLDADDLLHPKKIAQQLAMMANGNVDCVYCDAEIVPMDRSRPPRLQRHARHADPVIAALGSNTGTPSGLHRRDSFFSIGGFRDDLVAAQDRDFHLRLACSGKSFAWIDGALVTERRHDGSISSDHLRVIRQYESIVVPLFEKLIQTSCLSDARARAFAGFMARAARMAFRLDDRGVAEHYFAIARTMHRTGGLDVAYGRAGRWMHRAVGPRYTALGSQWLSRLRGRVQRNVAPLQFYRTDTLATLDATESVITKAPRRLNFGSGSLLWTKSRQLECYVSGWMQRLRHDKYTLREHISALLDWLLRAQQATPDDGVAESFYYPTACWRPSYPETTGYIICSLLRAANAGYGEPTVLKDAARRMGNWLADIQMSDGAFQGGNIAIKDPKPAVFNTGQILKGLTDLCGEGLDESRRLKASAERAARWLIKMQDADGAWRKGVSALTNAPTHAYKVRTAWALARYGRRFGDEEAVAAGIKNAEWLLTTREADDWFPLMNFDVGTDPLLHTIAYTICGLLELGDLCGREEFVEAARRAALRVATIQDPRTGAIAGQLARAYRPVVRWTNTTANSQMAVIWFRLAEITGESHWTDHAQRANAFNRSLHEINSRNPGARGAVRGSWPSRIGYGRNWYMNWTQKFFLDALLLEAGVAVR